MKASNNQSAATRALPAEGAERPSIVVVSGPTAVGKTALAIAIGHELGGEIVNADSRYLYRGFDIGVAKPDMHERAGIPHHLIDILSPDGEMSLARFQDMATETIHDVHRRGKLPILVGGTPLYINAVVEGWHIPRVPPDPALRSALAAEAAIHGIQVLSERLQAVDPPSALRCGGNLRRIIRALEVYEATGIPMSELEGKGPAPFNALEIALSLPRADLYRAIDRRIDDQINQALVQEVRGLLAKGVKKTPGMRVSVRQFFVLGLNDCRA